MSFMNPTSQASSKKSRGAFFTPQPIAKFLASWAIGGDASARVLDPTCGDGVFLLEAGRCLSGLGASEQGLRSQVYGVDIHVASLDDAHGTLVEEGLDSHLIESDFFALSSPGQPDSRIPVMDAVIGNPPFVRYQMHTGEARKLAAEAALRQKVRLSGLASSWAPLLVHASSFLSPEGRLAMVLPAELLTVQYAQPIRQWLLDRFESVNLVVFERLQFDDALADVVLLLAEGSGGCNAFSVYFVEDAKDLAAIQPFDERAISPAAEAKWTDLLLPTKQRRLFHNVVGEHFEALNTYGRVSLGAVTGNNNYFTLDEATRNEYGFDDSQLVRISPPGTRHLRGASFRKVDWESLREGGERVWLFRPELADDSKALERYIALGEKNEVDQGYKCSVRRPWWRPPVSEPPDLFFTYMSHRYPRLIANSARVSFLNSMHGIWLTRTGRPWLRPALSLLSLNSVTMLGAEVFGRSYGGGILKMEPTEAASLPVPSLDFLRQAWDVLRPEANRLDTALRRGNWTTVVARVDQVLLDDVLGLSSDSRESLHSAATTLRERRLVRGRGSGS